MHLVSLSRYVFELSESSVDFVYERIVHDPMCPYKGVSPCGSLKEECVHKSTSRTPTP